MYNIKDGLQPHTDFACHTLKDLSLKKIQQLISQSENSTHNDHVLTDTMLIYTQVECLFSLRKDTINVKRSKLSAYGGEIKFHR